ncbi:SurA N-terminal domain-containing protein [Candidatus Daviesbacteria bacterium]|nr:SurA N-terminal domain-containing protein [Candidatus Daviesbacteria bacterium]
MARKTQKSKTNATTAQISQKPKTVKQSKPELTQKDASQNLLNQILERLNNIKKVKLDKRGYLVLVVLALIILGLWKKEWFVAGTVNSSPITNFELLNKMNAQYRSQTLNQIINEKLILDAARKQNVTVSSQEVDNKISELITSVGGQETFESLLTQQNLTKEGLKDQIKLQLTVEKLYANEATVSAEEVDKFIEQNSALLTASESATQKVEAEKLIKQQKVSQIFSQKFQELKQQADIKIF